jgi:hypothetical protein
LFSPLFESTIEAWWGKDGLGDLGLVAANEKGFQRLSPKTMGPWKKPDILLKAYL